MKRKILSLILVFAMTVSLFTVGTGAVEPTYGDTAGHWAESSIERWSAYGIIQGSNGQFDPNGQLTCAQLATILAKLLKLPAAKDAGFIDNTADAWYYDAINRCAAAGILNGNGDGTVTPDAPISRERAMVMLARALGIEPISNPNLTKYTDAAQVSAYAQGYVAALIEAGIVGGVTADQLAPQANINRASTVTILDRAISTYADKAGATVKADGKGIVLVVAENVKITDAPEGTKIVVADGATGLTVNGKSVSDDQTYIVPKATTGSGSSSGGYSHSHSYDTTTHKCSCGAFDPEVVATIGNTNGYLTLETAVAAAQSGDTVTLAKDANMTNTISIEGGKKITLALNNHNVSITGQRKFIRVCNAELTVTGPGAVKEMHPYYSPILIKGGPTGSANYSVVNVGSGVTLEGWAGVFIDQNNGNNYGIALNVNEATLNSVNDVSGYSGSAVYVNGSITNENNMPKITLTNATLEATGAGMYLAGYADTTISGGSIAGAATAIEIRAGKLTLNGGSYTASAETYNCDPNGNGTTTSGAALAIAQHTTKKNINVMISGGTFTGVRALSESNPQANDPAPEVTLSITDGTFNGDVTIADKDHTSIAGGTFSTEPANEYIAKGYTKERDNGKWNVVPDTTKTYVAQVGVNKYVSLADALTAAQDGDTVKLVGNISTDEGIGVAKKITLDMAEYTITSSVNQVFTVTGSGDLTITGNGTIAGPTGGAAKDLDSKAVLMVSGESAKLTVLNGTITAGGVGDCGMYGIYVADGGNVILGDADTKTGPTIKTWFAAVGENNTTSPANITIYGGEYTAQAAPADNDRWAYFCAPVYASASGDINIYGGTFNGYYGISSRYVKVAQDLNISGGIFNGTKAALFVDNEEGSAKNGERTIALTGGTFSSNPGAYVAEGYKATKDESANTWTVEKKNWDDYDADGTTMPAGVKITSRDNNGNVTVTLEDEDAFKYFTQKFDMDAACSARKTALDNGATRYPGESVHNHLNIWYRAYHQVHVEMAKSVNLGGMEVTPFTEYSTFDGKGFTISNAKVSGADTSVGFFGGNPITNVKMDSISVTANNTQYAGVISGFNSSSITNVTVTRSTVTGGKNTGAIVGNCYVDLSDCTVENCTISGQYKVGGLAGYVCREDGQKRIISNNTLRNVTLKGENRISGKSDFVIGQAIGNWNARSGGSINVTTIENVTGADSLIGKIESDVATPSIDGKVQVGSQEALANAISSATADEETSIKLAAGTYTLPSLENKSITISGTKDTVINMKGEDGKGVVNKAKSASFDGVTVAFANENYKGFQHTETLIYKDCTIKGLQFLYANDVEFNNCTFEQEDGNSYHIWTYGAKNVTFTGCTFNSTSSSKAVLCYIEGTGNTFTRTFNNCTFKATGTAKKSAIMINPTANTGTNTYTVNIKNCTATGYAENGIPDQTIVGVTEPVKDTIIIKIDGKQIYSHSTGVIL